MPDTGEDSRPFYIDRVYFEEDCGLYFLADFHNDEIRRQVLFAITVLGERGIGTDRTVGNGLFSFDPAKDCKVLALNSPEKVSNRFITLGLFLPKESEIANLNLSESSWTLIKRGGYIGGSSEEQFRHLRKKSIYMFGEGSIFVSKTDVQGKFVDLKPDGDAPLHPVWRCGMPLILKY